MKCIPAGPIAGLHRLLGFGLGDDLDHGADALGAECLQQAEAGAVRSQVDALLKRVQDDGLTIDEESKFVDDGYSGAVLVRPDLERVREASAATGRCALICWRMRCGRTCAHSWQISSGSSRSTNAAWRTRPTLASGRASSRCSWQIGKVKRGMSRIADA